LAPRLDQLAARREAMHPAVAVSVRDVQLAVRRHRQVGRPVERWPRTRDRRNGAALLAAIGGLARTKRQQQLAVAGELLDDVSAVVHTVDTAVRSNGDAVRTRRELVLAP